ncbi:MAG: aminotransferase class IV [Acidocella sp.]|nr:aminotransferase class IV [Acidocella sp.]
MIIWLNGLIKPNETGRIDPTDRGFTLGDGVFETIRVVNRQPQHFERHLQRLRTGLALLAIPFEMKDVDLSEAISLVLKANHLYNAAIRLTVSRGPSPRGIIPAIDAIPTVLIAASPLPDPITPVNAVVCTVTRRNEMSPLSRIKSLNYLDSILARQEANHRGADDALLLNTRGYVAEATASNIIVFRSDQIVTPPLTHGALPGIMRSIFMEKYGAIEAPLLVEDLLASNAILLVNSLMLRPLVSIDGRELATRSECFVEITHQVMEGI